MGSFNLADGVTRLSLPYGTPVVGFLVSRNTAYPYGENPCSAPLFPCDLYQLVSLPIYGTYDDAGGIALQDDAQLAVKLALLQTGSASWEALQGRVLRSPDKGFPLFGRPDGEQMRPSTNIRHYGLFVVQREVYEQLLFSRFYREDLAFSVETQRTQDVSAVSAVANQFLRLSALNQPLSEQQNSQLYLGLNVLSLGGSYWEDDEGVQHDLPTLARIRDAGLGIGSDFWEALREVRLTSGMTRRTPKPVSLEDVPEYTELLTQLWNVKRFLKALHRYNVVITPSLRAGQGLNAEAQFEASSLSTRQAWKQWQAYRKDVGFEVADLEPLAQQVAELRSMVENMEAVLQTMRTQIN